ncbi:putative long-chain-fatty-acid--CoA ligase [Lupinus albus]|uniref:Putative long-chain-fatty-acid--CoA ligase n=1 Tax=Lupinus albus TaxID=3870 RepID=A0A6A4PYM3_LUPAL|nr:putative long-chain-fatty-acid--CoA ligase [Lupinus albus]
MLCNIYPGISILLLNFSAYLSQVWPGFSFVKYINQNFIFQYRKKNIFKLSQGEYIAPEKIENAYAKCKFVAQCFVYGDSLNSSLVAVVSVDHDVLKAWAASEGIMYNDLAQLCNDPKAKAAVLADMDACGREVELRGFEFVKVVTLVLEPFTMENGLLTPTFKIKRPQAKEYFAKAISDMYNELSKSGHSQKTF